MQVAAVLKLGCAAKPHLRVQVLGIIDICGIIRHSTSPLKFAVVARQSLNEGIAMIISMIIQAREKVGTV